MPNRADLQALIDRVEKATDNDPSLFRAVYMALLPEPGPFTQAAADAAAIEGFVVAGAFADAALALMERVLPGWSIQLYRHPDGAYANLYRLGEVASIIDGAVERHVATPYYESIRVCDAHLPLAIIAATLRAMQSQETE